MALNGSHNLMNSQIQNNLGSKRGPALKKALAIMTDQSAYLKLGSMKLSKSGNRTGKGKKK